MTSYDRVIGVISKPPCERLDQQITDLIPWLCKKSERIFNPLKQKPDVVADIIRNCEFVVMETDSVIIRQGERGDSFYIVLRGKVSVMISAECDVTAPVEYDEQGELDRTQFGHPVTSLVEGDAFGELALLNEDSTRNASVIADVRTDLIVISRELYNRSLCSWQLAELQAKHSFVQQHTLFRTWPAKYKRQLAMSLHREQATFDTVVLHQAQTVNNIYFIIRGQCKISVDTAIHQLQYSQILAANDVIKSRDSSHDVTSRSGQRVKRKHVDICLIEANELIGDVELVTGLSTYLQTVTCTQYTELYTLSSANYNRLVAHHRHNKKAVQQFRALVQTKLESRLIRLGPSTVPVLNCLLTRLLNPNNNRRATVFTLFSTTHNNNNNNTTRTRTRTKWYDPTKSLRRSRTLPCCLSTHQLTARRIPADIIQPDVTLSDVIADHDVTDAEVVFSDAPEQPAINDVTEHGLPETLTQCHVTPASDVRMTSQRGRTTSQRSYQASKAAQAVKRQPFPGAKVYIRYRAQSAGQLLPPSESTNKHTTPSNESFADRYLQLRQHQEPDNLDIVRHALITDTIPNSYITNYKGLQQSRTSPDRPCEQVGGVKVLVGGVNNGNAFRRKSVTWREATFHVIN